MKKFQLDITAVRELHRSGQLDAAKDGYLQILRNDPHSIEALDSLGILCAQQDNFTDALNYLQTAFNLQPKNPVINLHLANILKFQGLYSQAIEVLENSLKINPDYIPTYNNLGTLYFTQGKLDNAIHHYHRAIEKQPSYVDAYYNLGLAQSKQNDVEAAAQTYQKVLELSPEHFAARFQLACSYMQKNKLAEAIKQFLQIEVTHPNHFETQTNLATCFLKQGQLNEAKAHYFKALELTPEDTQILFNLGVINMQQGQIDLAIQQYQRAVRINPNLFAAHNNLGVAFLAKQHAGFALHHFQEALRIQPSNVAIQHTIKILTQHQHLLASPPDYVKSLFDSYADHYELHLLKALDYHVPDLLFSAVTAATKSSGKWDILDLGCGTGLCGIPFKQLAKTLTGVDLSPKMLEMAAQKNIYDHLEESELCTFLTDKKNCYDLILAGDVLVYIGDLAGIFSDMSNALREKGLIAFNTEIIDSAEFKMNQSGRFSHQKKYIETLADKNHFKVIYYKEVITRMQNNEPVYGHLIVLQK